MIFKNEEKWTFFIIYPYFNTCLLKHISIFKEKLHIRNLNINYLSCWRIYKWEKLYPLLIYHSQNTIYYTFRSNTFYLVNEIYFLWHLFVFCNTFVKSCLNNYIHKFSFILTLNNSFINFQKANHILLWIWFRDRKNKIIVTLFR